MGPSSNSNHSNSALDSRTNQNPNPAYFFPQNKPPVNFEPKPDQVTLNVKSFMNERDFKQVKISQ